jgi:hypothetical protein
VLYGVWLRPDFAATMQALGKSPSAMDSLVPLFVVVDFVYGIGLVWLYAAIRPRYGAGVKTAVIAGVAVWVFISLLRSISEAPMGLFPQRVYTLGTCVTLIEYAIAGAAGAYFYKEV